MTPRGGKTIFLHSSKQLPRLCLGPLNGFLSCVVSGTAEKQGHRQCQAQRSLDTVKNSWHKPWLSVCLKRICLHRSLIVKSQQNRVELVTRPGIFWKKDNLEYFTCVLSHHFYVSGACLLVSLLWWLASLSPSSSSSSRVSPSTQLTASTWRGRGQDSSGSGIINSNASLKVWTSGGRSPSNFWKIQNPGWFQQTHNQGLCQ